MNNQATLPALNENLFRALAMHRGQLDDPERIGFQQAALLEPLGKAILELDQVAELLDWIIEGRLSLHHVEQPCKRVVMTETKSLQDVLAEFRRLCDKLDEESLGAEVMHRTGIRLKKFGWKVVGVDRGMKFFTVDLGEKLCRVPFDFEKVYNESFDWKRPVVFDFALMPHKTRQLVLRSEAREHRLLTPDCDENDLLHGSLLNIKDGLLHQTILDCMAKEQLPEDRPYYRDGVLWFKCEGIEYKAFIDNDYIQVGGLEYLLGCFNESQMNSCGWSEFRRQNLRPQ